jgi:hypothetical protein
MYLFSVFLYTRMPIANQPSPGPYPPHPDMSLPARTDDVAGTTPCGVGQPGHGQRCIRALSARGRWKRRHINKTRRSKWQPCSEHQDWRPYLRLRFTLASRRLPLRHAACTVRRQHNPAGYQGMREQCANPRNACRCVAFIAGMAAELAVPGNSRVSSYIRPISSDDNEAME